MARAGVRIVVWIVMIGALIGGLAFVPSATVVVVVKGETATVDLPAIVLESRGYSSAVTVAATGRQDAAPAETRVSFSYSYSEPFIVGPKAVSGSVVSVPEGTVVRLCARADGDVFKNPNVCRGKIVEFRTTSAARVGAGPPPKCPTTSTSCAADPAEVRVVASTAGSAGNLGAFAVADGSYGEASVAYSDGTTRAYPITAFVVLPVEGGRDATSVVTDADLAEAREEASRTPHGLFRTQWPGHRVAGVRSKVELVQLGHGPLAVGDPGPVEVDARVQAALIGYRQADLAGAVAQRPGNSNDLVSLEVVDWRTDAEVTDAVQATATLAAVSSADVTQLIRGRSWASAQRRLDAVGARLVSPRPRLPIFPIRVDVRLVPAR